MQSLPHHCICTEYCGTPLAWATHTLRLSETYQDLEYDWCLLIGCLLCLLDSGQTRTWTSFTLGAIGLTHPQFHILRDLDTAIIYTISLSSVLSFSSFSNMLGLRMFSSAARALIKWTGFDRNKLPEPYKEAVKTFTAPGGGAEQVICVFSSFRIYHTL